MESLATLRAELEDLGRNAGNLSVFTRLERATPEDRRSPHFAGEGRVTRALLREKLPLDAYQAYLCGPEPFMRAVRKFASVAGGAK